MSRIRINGVDVVGGYNITIRGNRVLVDGKDVTPDNKEIRVEVAGNINLIEIDTCDSIYITGDVGTIKTVSGDVRVGGSISGSVQTVSGDVDCDGSIGGSIATVSGDVKSSR